MIQGRTRGERTARLVTAALLLGLAALGLAGAWGLGAGDGTIDLVARQPGAGGFSRERIVVRQGERVRLRIRAEDVVHGFAIGRMGVDAGPIQPGKTVTVEFTPAEAGEFTYYCTEWCDPNHSRMRGILEVRGRAVAATPRPDPASNVLLQHLDDPRDAGGVPMALPSAERGRALYRARCADCHGAEGGGTARGGPLDRRTTLRDRSPAALVRMLAGPTPSHAGPRAGAHAPGVPGPARAAPPHAPHARGWGAQERWDAVAFLWWRGVSLERLALGQRVYGRNCAACHGETGKGDGAGGRSQPKLPADFTDLRRMLAGTTELYTAKIRRGGMGTGMPYWGSIFTEEELASLVDHLWRFSLGQPAAAGEGSK